MIGGEAPKETSSSAIFPSRMQPVGHEEDHLHGDRRQHWARIAGGGFDCLLVAAMLCRVTRFAHHGRSGTVL